MEEWRTIYFVKAFECSFPILEALHYNAQQYPEYYLQDMIPHKFASTNMDLAAKTMLIIGKRAMGKSSLVNSLVVMTPNELQYLEKDNLSRFTQEITQNPLLKLTFVLEGLEGLEQFNGHQKIALRNLFFRVRHSKYCRIIITVQYVDATFTTLPFECYFLGRLNERDCCKMQQFLNFPIKNQDIKLDYWMRTISQLKLGQWFLGEIYPNRKYGILNHHILN